MALLKSSTCCAFRNNKKVVIQNYEAKIENNSYLLILNYEILFLCSKDMKYTIIMLTIWRIVIARAIARSSPLLVQILIKRKTNQKRD